MKKKHSTIIAFIQKCIILLIFWLIVYVMLRIFSSMKAASVHDTIKKNLLGGSSEQVHFFEKFTEEIDMDHEFTYPDQVLGYYLFFDNNDREWLEKNCGGFPELTEDSLSHIKYYGELTPGEYSGHTGYYTVVTEAYPLNITRDTDDYLHNNIDHIVLLFMLIIAISSIVVYNKSRSDTKTAENVLIAGLSHDLKEPLESLRTTSEEWIQADDSEKNAKSSAVISDVSRMDSIIKKQLKLRDLGSGVIDLKKEEVDLHYMLRKVIAELRSAFSKRKITVNDRTADDEYIVNADPQLLQLVISNMLLVAADNTEKDIFVKVDGGVRHKRHDYVRLTVSCTGSLFRDLVSGALWSVVTDSDSSRTAAFGSQGVGLATMVPILKAHDAGYGKNGEDQEAGFWIELKKVEDE